VIVRKKEAERRLGRQLAGRARDWYLLSKDGTKNLGGPYPSKARALQREKEVQYFKRVAPNPAQGRVSWTPSTFEMFYFREGGLEPGDVGTVVGNTGDSENDIMVDWDGKGRIAVPLAALRRATSRNPEEKPQLPARRKKAEPVETEVIPLGWEKMWPMYVPSKSTMPVPVTKPGKLIEGRVSEEKTFEEEDPELQRALLEKMMELGRARESEMKDWEKRMRGRGPARNSMVFSAAGNAGDVNSLAYEMRQRYIDDKAAGHLDAAEYWRGQAAAYFTGNPSPWMDLDIEGVTVRVDHNYSITWMSDWNKVWEFVQKGYFTPIGKGPPQYGDVAFYLTSIRPIAQNPGPGQREARYKIWVKSERNPSWRIWKNARSLNQVVYEVIDTLNHWADRGVLGFEFMAADVMYQDPSQDITPYRVYYATEMTPNMQFWQMFYGCDQVLQACIQQNDIARRRPGGYIKFLIEAPEMVGIKRNSMVYSAAGNPYASNSGKEPGAFQRIAEGVAVYGLSAMGLKALGISPNPMNPAKYTLQQARRELRRLGYMLKKSRGRKEKDIFLRTSKYIILSMSFPSLRIGARNLGAVSEFINIVKRGMPSFIGGTT